MNKNCIKELLEFIYGKSEADAILPPLLEIIGEPSAGAPVEQRAITNKDAFLICYGDMLAGEGETALARLGRFLSSWNRGAFSFLHLLPFHPYSSDDGFSVIDYYKIDPCLGGWNDVDELGLHFKLVFDFVVNHGSVQSEWFKKFLAGEEGYRNWYCTRPENYDCSKVFRPRTHPLLTTFEKEDGTTANVWTTFSADQVDYDFSGTEVLLEFIRIFLNYCRRGARMLRLDAIAFLWKEDGTPCVHHPKTHAFVQLLRAIADYLRLPVILLTETNVPHRDNISYFGGSFVLDASVPAGEEAHMVYNFALPPLVLHAAVSGNAVPLRKWAAALPALPAGKYFLNFLASHDGVGLGPARGLIDDSDFGKTLEKAKERGALISMKSTPAGPVPYELNCSWADMVAPVSLGTAEVQARAFLATYAAALSLPGLPAVYFHSWIGSRAWKEGPQVLGYNRAINREKPLIDTIEKELMEKELTEKELTEKDSFRSLVMDGFRKLFNFRSAHEAFNPEAPCRIIDSKAEGIFAVHRSSANADDVLCVQNFSEVEVRFDPVLPPLGVITVAAHGLVWIAFNSGGIRRELAI
ncbi:MAG: alpha-amylase family glycosyl hydrolase [Treponema sp.]|nr:alpha-amylase family glycosyl hydrolase [Treponema sp.]